MCSILIEKKVFYRKKIVKSNMYIRHGPRDLVISEVHCSFYLFDNVYFKGAMSHGQWIFCGIKRGRGRKCRNL